MKDQDPGESDQRNDSGESELPLIHPLAACFPLLNETHFTELMKEDVKRRGVLRRQDTAGSRSDEQATEQVGMNRTAALVMLFGAFFGAFCLEPGTTSQSVLYAVAVALMGGHFLYLLGDATRDPAQSAVRHRR